MTEDVEFAAKIADCLQTIYGCVVQLESYNGLLTACESPQDLTISLRPRLVEDNTTQELSEGVELKINGRQLSSETLTCLLTEALSSGQMKSSADRLLHAATALRALFGTAENQQSANQSKSTELPQSQPAAGSSNVWGDSPVPVAARQAEPVTATSVGVMPEHSMLDQGFMSLGVGESFRTLPRQSQLPSNPSGNSWIASQTLGANSVLPVQVPKVLKVPLSLHGSGTVIPPVT